MSDSNAVMRCGSDCGNEYKCVFPECVSVEALLEVNLALKQDKLKSANEIAELKAKVADLENIDRNAHRSEVIGFHEGMKAQAKLENKIKADAIQEAARSILALKFNGMGYINIDDLDEYADKLRRGE